MSSFSMPLDRSASSQPSRPSTSQEIREAFLSFYADRGHQIIPSASLIPEDPTVLLTIAGMLPFKPVFLGQQDRPAARAVSTQKCIRTNDIENVGRTARHQTFFEMLGNFSFGDYFKKDAILWAWELSTEVFGLDPKNLVISVFREDNEAARIWKEVVGVDPARIIFMDEDDNFWSSGPTGPCGPCSEIYYDFNPELGNLDIDLDDDSRFIEFYNLVFMQYNRDTEGKLKPLANCNIDTGLGLERMAQILQNVPNNYETDLIYPLILKSASIAGLDYLKIDEQKKISLKIIGDHSRAVTHLICDGVLASNLGRGYILRRLLRRMIRHGRLLGIEDPFLTILGDTTINLMKNTFPQLVERRDAILSEMEMEESRFRQTLERGEQLLQEVLAKKPVNISGLEAFELYDTYGFPLELTQEIAEENGLKVDVKGFEFEMKKQRERAKNAAVSIDLTLQSSITQISSNLQPTFFNGYDKLQHSSEVLAIVLNGKLTDTANLGDEVQIVLDKTPFFGESGGQIGDRGFLFGEESVVEINDVKREKNIFVHSGMIQKGIISVNDLLNAQVDQICRRKAQANHTATHLLQSALKSIVDSNIGQRGSLVAFDRLRFDFNYSQQLTTKQLEKLEILINTWILEDHPIRIKTVPIKEALAEGALAMFGEKYGENVRVVDIPGVSMELCGGTHMAKTSDLGVFKIISESGVASGIRRIEAIAGPAILDYLNERDLVVRQLSDRLKAQPSEIFERIVSLQDELKSTGKALLEARVDLGRAKALSLATEVVVIGKSQLIVQRIDGIDGNTLQVAAQDLLEHLGESAAIVLGGQPDSQEANKVILVAAFGSEVIDTGLQAGQFIGGIAKICGGGGGGRRNLAQAGGRDAKSLPHALDVALKELSNSLS